MPPDTAPAAVQDLIVAADHGQIYVYSPVAAADDDSDNPYLAALDDAVESGRFVGTRPGLIDVMTPGQWNFQTPMRLEVWSAEPPDDSQDWDHEVDVDLDVPDGHLIFEASGGGPAIPASIPPGSYRVRVSGHGFTDLGAAGAEGGDHYRLRMWPHDRQDTPMLRKRWHGWDAYR
jgi:hypothetical protein